MRISGHKQRSLLPYLKADPSISLLKLSSAGSSNVTTTDSGRSLVGFSETQSGAKNSVAGMSAYGTYGHLKKTVDTCRHDK
jgi:hypothetical protein